MLIFKNIPVCPCPQAGGDRQACLPAGRDELRIFGVQ